MIFLQSSKLMWHRAIWWVLFLVQIFPFVSQLVTAIDKTGETERVLKKKQLCFFHPEVKLPGLRELHVIVVRMCCILLRKYLANFWTFRKTRPRSETPRSKRASCYCSLHVLNFATDEINLGNNFWHLGKLAHWGP